MAKEFQHKDPGSELTQAEFITTDGTGHIVDSQAAGDILYASSSTVLKGLVKATDGNVLELASGLPAWTASPTIGSTSWANANHAHAASNSGGTLTALGTVTTGVWNGTAIVKAYIGADAIDGSKIEDGAINSEHYTNASIDNAHLADDAVDSDELAAGAVDTAHIGDNQVTAAKIFDLARGSVIIGNDSAATAELTIGSNTYVLASDGTDIAWTAASAGAVARDGGQLTEATSTSTSATDLLTSSTLSIAATTPFMFISSNRKTTGATDVTSVGLKLNSTVVGAPSTNALHNSKYVWGGRNDNLAGDGGSVVWSGSRIANYLQSVYGDGVESPSETATGGGEMSGTRLNISANSPTATITAVIFNIKVGDSAITQGSDELHVYTYASS